MFPKSVFVVFIGLCVQFPNISLCTSAIGPITDTNYCQEFHTQADRYVNFFPLEYFQNERLDDEMFRYKFFVKGDEDIFILFAENDSVDSYTKCYEFGINTENPPAATFKTAIGESEKVRTQEKLSVSRQMPMSLEIVDRKDGVVQMFVENKPYPLIRFPGNTLEPNFISFASRNGNSATFFFNCRRQLNERVDDGLLIADERVRPVLYISFRINTIKRTSQKVSIDMYYNMTQFTDPNAPFVFEKSSVLKLAKSQVQLPKLEIFSNNLEVARKVPAYDLRIGENKITESANETLNINCMEAGNIYCSLSFGLENAKYHLTHYPSGPLFEAAYAKSVNVKVFQSPNSASVSEVPFKGDVNMELKIVP